VRFRHPQPRRKERDEKSIYNLVSIMNDAGNRNSHGDRLVHFIVLLAELLVAEKLRVHTFQGFLRVLLWLFDA
jgi:hypothetical protein